MTVAHGHRAQGQGGTAHLRWWHGLAAGLLLMVSPGASLLLVVLSAPVMLVLLVDTTHGRVLSRSVGLFLIAGMVAPGRRFLFEGHSLSNAFAILADPGTILFTWTLGACGWLVTECFSLVAVFAQNRKQEMESRELQARMEEIRKEWELDDV